MLHLLYVLLATARSSLKPQRELALENPMWGAPRIHGELLMLGFEVGKAAVSRHRVLRSERRSWNGLGEAQGAGGTDDLPATIGLGRSLGDFAQGQPRLR